MQQTSRSLALAVLTGATIALSQPAASFDFSPGRWMSPGNWFGGSRDNDYYYGGSRGYYAPPPGYYQAPPAGYGYGYAQPAYQVPPQPYGAQQTYQAPAQPYGAQQVYQAPTPSSTPRQTQQAPQLAPARPQTAGSAAPAYPPMEEPMPGSGGYVPEGYLSDIPDEYPVGTYAPAGYMADVPEQSAPAATGYPSMEEPALPIERYVPQDYSAASE
jgi:hypothetical protein